MSNMRTQLLAEIEAFISKHDIRPSYFGREVINDFSLVHRLRRGGDVRLETVEKIRNYMATYKGTRKPVRNAGPKRRSNASKA